ncbi:hypothetical protein SAMN05192559_101915 [Halobacillus karajensis]|uniref:hypothetical protein n=1 Tax=Halobacillus karajensis TaxID=195088 RepID=UPI0008A80F23|nr:hypothetical protein [Halobacillus karajensis]SEH51047.1 hypothetical protein SAMN05192559_101915 [Halobacillus karajensis]
MNLSWKLIVALGAMALIRPLLSGTGVLDMIGQPTASLTVTLAITIIWIMIVITKNVPRPVATLAGAGLVYGIAAIIISGILSPILTGELQGPLTNPLAVISVLITNGIWGLIAGSLASLFKKISKE